MKQIAVHHTAVRRTNSKQLRGVDRHHRDKFGMLSSLGWYVCYHEFVDVNGQITKCRMDTEETCANRGHNCNVPEKCDTYSVCFALDGDTQTFNEAQIKAWRKIEKRKNLKTVLHKDIQVNRTCPGRRITLEYLDGLLSDDRDNNQEKKENIRPKKRLMACIIKCISRNN